MAPGAKGGALPLISGPAQFAVRSRTLPGGEVWFTCGQAWEYDSEDGPAYAISMTMTPVNWDGNLLLIPTAEDLRSHSHD